LGTGPGRRAWAEAPIGLAVELHDESVLSFVRRFVYVPGWAEKEKFDGEASRLSVEGSMAAVQGILDPAAHDLATGCAVRQNPNKAARIPSIHPVPDISGAHDRVAIVVNSSSGDEIRDLLKSEPKQNAQQYAPNHKGQSAPKARAPVGTRRRLGLMGQRWRSAQRPQIACESKFWESERIPLFFKKKCATVLVL
jgi:hypothetical protein